MRRYAIVGLATLLGACTDAADVEVDDTDDTTSAPDLAGTYALALDAGAECPGAWDWAAASLTVSGTADALVFDFGEVGFDGTVDGAFAFEFGGLVAFGDGNLDVDASGVTFTDENDRWVLDGSIELTAIGVDSSCSTTATFVATQES